jgi:hypothetical protein
MWLPAVTLADLLPSIHPHQADHPAAAAHFFADLQPVSVVSSGRPSTAARAASSAAAAWKTS